MAGRLALAGGAEAEVQSRGRSIKGTVVSAAALLRTTGTETPRLDAEVLMAFALGWERTKLFAHWDEDLAPDIAARFEALVGRRANGEPVAYIRQRKEFLGLDFYVDSRVLIPRPETELLVSRAVAWLAGRPHARVVDVGTGSGAVAVAVVRECPDVDLLAIDVSEQALEVARINSQRHGTRIRFEQGSLLEPVAGPVDLIVANLPYLSGEEYASLRETSIWFEPAAALTDGADGLVLFRQLFKQIPYKLAASGCVLLEIGAGQPRPLLELARAEVPSFTATVYADYAGLPRVLQLSARPS